MMVITYSSPEALLGLCILLIRAVFRLLTKNEKDFKVLNTGESFGEASLFLGQERDLGQSQLAKQPFMLLMLTK